MIERTQTSLSRLGRFNQDQASLVRSMHEQNKVFPSGRWLWCGGTPWMEKQSNFYGAYNCSTTKVEELYDLIRLMNLSMCGSGVGWLVEDVSSLPSIKRRINLTTTGEFGSKPSKEITHTDYGLGKNVKLLVGDSREGWCQTYYQVLDIFTQDGLEDDLDLTINFSHVRKADELIKGFGGKTNPKDLVLFFQEIVSFLNERVNKKLTPTDVTWLACRSLATVVAGNIRRCLPEDTLVNTSKGLIAIKDIQIGDFVYTPVGLRRVTNKFNQGIQDYWIMKTNHADLRATPNHRVGVVGLVKRSYIWKRLDELTVDDQLFTNTKLTLAITGEYRVDSAHTWDIEVEEVNCFYCELFLMHNSAGIAQGAYDDDEFAQAKTGMWTQSKDGKWYIDPKKDALRMANFTRVYHHKPTYDEILSAVRTQYYSSEGAIQYAPEAIARSNADILHNERLKQNFLNAYCNSKNQGRIQLAWAYYHQFNEHVDESELEHRMGRYLLNPCFVAGTMVVTKLGHFPIESLVGQSVEIWDGEDWICVDNFRITGKEEPVFKITMNSGESITSTPNHQFYLNDGSPRKLYELKVGDILLTHDKGEFDHNRTVAYKTCDEEYNVIKEGVFNLSPNPTSIVSIEFSYVADLVYCCTVPTNHQFALSCNVMVGNCGEEVQLNNLCNLGEVHLNNIDPSDGIEQMLAFEAATLSVAALLHHSFDDDKYQYSREIDPRVQVSFTGLFDFFVKAFGVEWLQWWQAGRPDTDEGIDFKEQEQGYLTLWRDTVKDTLQEYCYNHRLRMPNRYTGVQPSGSKSLLTGASPGWHPPKAQRFIRRITFQAYHPVAKACIDYGYSVIPSQSCKDEDGHLLDDAYDPRVHEWLIEIPVEVSWANIPGVDQIEIEKFSALAQFDFYMQVQNFYTTINTSATIEFREDEIDDLAQAIHSTIEVDGGYISAALQARFDAPFPRLPFEKINKETYDLLQSQVIARRKPGTYYEHLMRHDKGWTSEEGATGCDSDKCLFPLAKPE